MLMVIRLDIEHAKTEKEYQFTNGMCANGKDSDQTHLAKDNSYFTREETLSSVFWDTIIS